MNKTDSFCPFVTAITQSHNIHPPSFLHSPVPWGESLWISLSSATTRAPCVVLMIFSVMEWSGFVAPHDSLLLFCCLPVFTCLNSTPAEILWASCIPTAWCLNSWFWTGWIFILLEALSLCLLHLHLIFFLFLALIATCIFQLSQSQLSY